MDNTNGGTAAMGTSQHVYRLALYGRPSSGKTCILAALAMMREAHPSGYSCVWICDETSVPKPAGERDSWNPDDPTVAAYLGKQYLKEAVRRLEAGDIPKFTPISATLRYYFDFTTSEGRVLRVEMIDYSGELVNPEMSEDRFAKFLRGHMEEADGILILAEAPRPGEEYAPLYQHLLRLQQAFMQIAERRRGKQTDAFPIGLGLNKWDRVTQMEQFDPQQCEIETRLFLQRKPPVPQRTLVNVIAAVAGQEDEQPLSRTFGLSAFGKARTVSRKTEKGSVNVDLPASTSPLPAFGLEDPFIWLCESSDKVAERELKDAVRSLRAWKVWQLVGRKPLRVAADATRFARRFPRKSTTAKAARSIANRCRVTFLGQGVTAAMLFLVFCFGMLQAGVMWNDNRHLTRLYPAITDDAPAEPLARLPHWQEAEAFLGGYTKPAWYRWGSHSLVLSRGKASDHLESVRLRLGPAHDLASAQKSLQDRLAGYAQRAQNPQTMKTELLAIRKEVESLQVPPALRDAEVERGKLLTLVDQAIGDNDINTAKNAIRRKYHDFMRRNNLDPAAVVVVQEASRYPDLKKELEGDFVDRAARSLREYSEARCQEQDWSAALESVSRFKRSASVTALLDARVIAKAEVLERWIKSHRAEASYNRWTLAPDDAAAQQAVFGADDSEYKEEVQKYTQYVNQLAMKRDWTLEVVSIYYQWDGSEVGDNTIANVGVSAAGAAITPRVRGGGNYRKGYEVAINSRLTVKNLRFDDPFPIAINVNSTNFTFGNESLGSASLSLSPRTLAHPIGYDVNLTAYRGVTNRVRLRVIDPPPLMPLRRPARGLPPLNFP